MGDTPSPLPDGRLEQQLDDLKPRYTAAEAVAEAERCLGCADAPCIQACPTEIDIPGFIRKIASGNVRGAARTIFEQNKLGVSCARVCPVEVLCVGSCVYTGWGREPIQIGRLQRYATETALERGPSLFTAKPPSGKKVALVGGGPASLACAAELALAGHHPVIFEARPFAGGLNTTGIAPYKLHASDSLAEIDWLLSLGVELRPGVQVGHDISGEALLAQYDAVFLGVGLGADQKLGLPGEDGPGVVGATAWIEALKMQPGTAAPRGHVIVIGGGNTAIDVARETAVLGAESVTLAYRRSPADLSAYAHEVDAGRLSGVRLLTHARPLAFVRGPDNALLGVRFEVQGAGEKQYPCDFAAVAIGQHKLRELAAELPGVELDHRGWLVADATGATGNSKVFTGGDCRNGGKEVVNAVAEGRDAARELIRRWNG